MTQLEIGNLALRKLGEAKITALNATTPAAQAVSELYQPTLDSLLRKYRWNFARKSASLKPVFHEMDDLLDSGAADLIQVEANAHGAQTGDRVVLKDTGADGIYSITRIDAHNFTCDDSKFTSSLTVGSFHLAPIHTWGYKIALPDDCIALRTVNGYEANRPHEFYTREGSFILTDAEQIDIVYTRSLTGGTDEGEFDVVFIQAFACLLAAELAMPVTGAISRRNDMMQMFQEEITAGLMSNVFERRDPNVDRVSGTSYETRIYG